MSRNILVYLDYILDSIKMIKEYAAPLNESDFLSSRHDQDAIIRRLEVIGEASKRIPDSIREKYPDIPWRKMAQFRDVLAHDYMYLNMSTVWLTVTNHIIPLESKMVDIIKDIK